jgi:hypothetical protein
LFRAEDLIVPVDLEVQEHLHLGLIFIIIMMDKEEEGMAFQIPDYSSTQPSEELQYYTSSRPLQGSQGEERPSPGLAEAFEGCLKALNIDALTNIDRDIQKGSEQESHLLLKKLE